MEKSKAKTTFNLAQTLFYMLMLCMSLFSCIKEKDFDFDRLAQTSWNPDVALPLIHSILDVEDITGLTDTSTFSSDSNNLLKLIYRGNIYSIRGNQFFPILDQADSADFSLNSVDSTALYSTGSFSKSVTRMAPFIFQNGTCDSLSVRSGVLRINFISNIPHSGVVDVFIPDALKNGQPLNCQLPFNWTGGNVQNSLEVDLSGYFLNLHSGSFPGVLNIVYTINYSNTGTTLPVQGKQSSLKLDFSSIQFASAFGNFGQQPINLFEDSALITLFNNFQNGTLFFDDPSMTFTLKNSFGMPIDARVISLAALDKSGNSYMFTGAIPDPLPIGYPTVPGQTATGSFTLDKNNSNISTIISRCPEYILYTLNANGNAPVPSYNFLLDTSAFTADIRIDLPLKGYASGFTIQDTAEFNLERIEEMKSATFRINVENGFPATAYTQLYFTDSSFNILDSMITSITDAIIESASVDNNGKVTFPTRKITDEYFNSSRLEQLYNAKKILIRSTINTKDYQSNRIVEIYNYYKMDVKIGVRSELTIK